jgi:predicted ArsR family transcriptional regulator
LLIEVAAPRDQLAMVWRKDGDGTPILIQVTDEGLRAIGIDPNEGRVARDTAPQGEESETPQQDDAEAEQPTQAAPQAPNMGSVNLREAAERLLAAWEDAPPPNADKDPIAQAMAMLRNALSRRGARATGAPRKPREGTKQEVVLAMLRRPEGATVAQIAEATGWAQHTVRGFFAGLKKRQGITVEIAERIRQVGPNKQGAKGSYTVYRVAE